MNTYEKLQDEACRDNIEIIDKYPFISERISGLYCNNTIALSKHLKNVAERACILAEELGHYYTTSGNILDQSLVGNRKQEYRARLWAYNKLIGLQGIIRAYNAGCQNCHEAAEYLDVTEDFLKEALTCYRNQYGLCTTVDNYTLFFEPALSVLELV